MDLCLCDVTLYLEQHHSNISFPGVQIAPRRGSRTLEVCLTATITSRLLLHSASSSILLLLPPPSSPQRYPASPRLSLCIFKLFPSPIQSNPSPTHSLFFPFEVWLSGDEKRLLVRPPTPPPRARFITCLFDCISPFCCAWLPPLLSPPSFIYIEGRESEIERRSEELFKQNANGLLMDPHFFFFSSYSLFLFVALPGGWLAKCCIESDTGVRLCGETKPQLGATRPPPSYKVRLIYMEREGGLNPRGACFFAHVVSCLENLQRTYRNMKTFICRCTSHKAQEEHATKSSDNCFAVPFLAIRCHRILQTGPSRCLVIIK